MFKLLPACFEFTEFCAKVGNRELAIEGGRSNSDNSPIEGGRSKKSLLQ